MNSDITERKTEELNEGNAFATFNHLRPEHVERDYAVFALEIRPESLNPYGFVHGGMLAAMADNAAGFAAHSDGRTYVTQSSQLNYVHNQAAGTIRAIGRVVHRGRTIVLTHVDIVGADGTLLATGDLTYFCVDQNALERRMEESAHSGHAM